jgi:competence protein ComEA
MVSYRGGTMDWKKEWDRNGKKWIGGALLAGAMVVTGAFFYTNFNKPVNMTPVVAADMEDRGKIMVYVTGAVKSPGVYELDRGARWYDAVRAAGDIVPYADLEAINLSEQVGDGDKLVIPLNPDKTNPAAAGMVNINLAGSREIEELPGVGESTAQKILEYRKEHGAFKTKEEIKNVPGIGEGKFKKMKDRMVL